jgi:hypothetical protein
VHVQLPEVDWMVSKIENSLALEFAAPPHESGATRSTQTFADLLGSETVGALLGELQKRGIDTSKLLAQNGNGSQNSVAPQTASQVLDTPVSTTAANTSYVSPFDPKPSTLVNSDTAAAEAATEAPFAPEFQQDQTVTSFYGPPIPLNPTFLPTRATAEWLAQKYGTGEVVASSYMPPGEPYNSTATQYSIRLKDGSLFPAGDLAHYYWLAPESQFPNVADELIRSNFRSQLGSSAV